MRGKVKPEKTKRPPVSDAGDDATEPTTAAPGQHDGQISRPVILRAALRIVDRDGFDGLSMRRLSDEVGRDPTVLYRHIPNKAALLDGVAAQLLAVAHDFRRLALEHPNVVPLLVTRPLATPLGQRPPGMLRPLEDVLALLTRAGFAGGDALRIYRVFFGYLSGPASGRRPCGSTSAGDCSPRRAPTGEPADTATTILNASSGSPNSSIRASTRPASPTSWTWKPRPSA